MATFAPNRRRTSTRSRYANTRAWDAQTRSLTHAPTQEILFSEEGFRLKRKPEAEKKATDTRFASSKAISSDDYFGRKEEQDPEVTAR